MLGVIVFATVASGGTLLTGAVLGMAGAGLVEFALRNEPASLDRYFGRPDTSINQTASDLDHTAALAAIPRPPPATQQAGSFNLSMGDERPATIYPALLNRDQDLRRASETVAANRGEFPVELTRHHIIPYNNLRDFWNSMLRNEAFKHNSPLIVGMHNLTRDDNVFWLNVRDDFLRDAAQLRQLLSDILELRITHNPHETRRPEGWDSLQQLYAWMPGNLFIGPSAGGGAFQHSDDPGEGFERNAGTVVGRTFPTFVALDGPQEPHRPPALITEYQQRPTPQLADQITRLLGQIVSRPQLFALRATNWLRDRRNRYRLRTEADH